MTDAILVCYDNTSGDIPVLTVGRKEGNVIDIFNAFQGDEAVELYKKLTTVKTE